MTENQKFLIAEIEKNGLLADPTAWGERASVSEASFICLQNDYVAWAKLHSELGASNFTVYKLVLFFEQALKKANLVLKESWVI